jgi:hypothetical protein
LKLQGDEDRPTSWEEMDSSEVALIGDVPRPLPLRVIAPADGEPLRMRRDMAQAQNGSGCVVALCVLVLGAAVLVKAIVEFWR